MKRAAALLGLILFLFPTALIAGTTASITGVVTHDSVPMAGVEVSLSSPAMQGSRSTTTDVNGRYAFLAIPPGEYTVTFEFAGMQTASTMVAAGLGQMGRADAAMNPRENEGPGGAEARIAATETKSVQANISASVVDALPVNRDLPSTLGISPRIPVGTTSWRVDGGDSIDPRFGGHRTIYVEDAIQETAVLTAGVPAEYGRFGGNVVNAITKSGGNEWSGSFRDAFTNPSWTARTPFQNVSNTDENDQTFEATFGGRILRDQLWFFAAGRYFDDTSQLFYVESPSWGYTTTKHERRWQAKLTGQLLDGHTLVGSVTDDRATFNNFCPWCIEPSAIDEDRKSTHPSLTTAHYTGIFGPRLVAEAFWSATKLDFTGGAETTDLATGTSGVDETNGGAFGAPFFCAVCPQSGDSSEISTYGLKTSWYLATKAAGTHSITGGYEHLESDHLVNNYQSGSSFGILTYSMEQHYDLKPGEVFRPIIEPGDVIAWYPIVSIDRPSDQQIHSVFIDDRWSLGSHWSFGVGIRYDLNDIVDERGVEVSDSSNLQPRFSASWDARGDGRYRVNGSYGEYVDRITTMVGSSTSIGGRPLFLYWYYEGPTIEGLPTPDAFSRVFEWFNAQCDAAGNCGTANLDALADVKGTSARKFGSSLKSPVATDMSLGFSVAAGVNGYIRLDAVTRKWNDFLTVSVSQGAGQTTDPYGNVLDWQVIGNDDAGLKARYDALILQGSYRFTPRWNVGGNYIWSRDRGNANPTGSGWVQSANYYREINGFPQHNPVIEVKDHELHAWLLYNIATSLGTFDVSALQNFSSGGAYIAEAGISTGYAADVRKKYANAPTRTLYIFSGTDIYRFGNITSTDLDVRYQLPTHWSGAFLELAVANVFNESGQVGGDTYIATAGRGCLQAPNGPNPGMPCRTFNPYTETPVEGVHYVKSPTFGQPMASAHYQTPRTYSFSAGVRF